MSLTSRLSAFFLAGLAVVLAGFSLCTYLIADDYLKRREQDRLQSASDSLRAMVEVDPDGIEWEGRERGAHELRGEVSWAVHVGDGVLLDYSDNLGSDDPVRLPAMQSADGEVARPQRGPDRRAVRRVFRVDSLITPKKHSALTLTVAISTKAREALQQQLAGTLVGVSCAIWLLALIGGRWYCRRALRPVAAMAIQAQVMDADKGAERLTVDATGDELETLGRSFNGLLDRLHEALERQKRFTGDASHQLRTPLAGLLGQVEIALRRDRESDDYRQTLEQVREQAEQLRRIVEMLLFLARADAEARIDNLTILDLAAWLTEQLRRWEGHPRRRDLHIFSTAPCLVRAQGPLLGQLLDNLIDNALKFSEPGTPVTIRLDRDAHFVRLAVEDEGVGIHVEDQERLFEPFFRSVHAHSVDRAGVGLGLSVAKRIAEVMSGTISAQPRASRGSRFVLTLPATGDASNA
jgi:two-component system, OmpR family, sensor kinase